MKSHKIASQYLVKTGRIGLRHKISFLYKAQFVKIIMLNPKIKMDCKLNSAIIARSGVNTLIDDKAMKKMFSENKGGLLKIKF